MSKVLITGGSGFIAGHCIQLLLERGYNVVTTVRSHAKGSKVLDANPAYAKKNLNYHIVEDVAQPGSFDEVVKATTGLDFVVHTTSPFHYNIQDPVKDFLEPAVNGTTNILKAVKAGAPSVKRVVALSSFASMRDDSGFFDESKWNPVTWQEATENTKKTYQGSKTLAERAAWDFMKDEKPNFELAVINPSLVFGPAAPHLTPGDLDSLNTSNQRILDMIDGKMKDKLEPTGFYSWVDVRDVAYAHVQALEVPEAAGKRFLLMAGYYSNKEIAQIVASISPELKEKLPADLDKVESDLPEDPYKFSAKRSMDVLGLKYTSLEKSIKDTVESLLKLKT